MATQNTQINSSYETILKQSGRPGGGIFRFSKTYPAFIILIIFLALSFLVKDFFERQVRIENQAAFDKATASVVNRFESKYQMDDEILTSMRGIYDRLIQIVRDYFELYASVPIKTYPSIRSMMYLENVSSSRTFDFEFYAQSTVNPSYKIKPQGARPSYEPVLYVVPQDKNLHLLGNDFYVNPVLMELLNKSRDSDQIVASHVFDVRKPDTVGFYLIASVYKKDSTRSTVEQRRQHYTGAVVMEVDPRLYFDEALGEGIASDTTIIFDVYDAGSDGKDNLIYSSKNSEKYKNNYSPDLFQEHTLRIADKQFNVKFATVPHFTGSFQKILPLLAFGISLVLSFAFFGFLLAVTTSQARAVDLAERLTRSQRRIVDSSKDVIAVMDLEGTWKSMNPASINIFGFEPADMIGQKIDGLFHQGKDIRSFHSLIETAEDEVTQRVDYPMLAPLGSWKWINWSFSIAKNDGFVYCIGRDVTLEKIAEEQAQIRSKQIQLAEQFTREASEFKSLFMIKLSHQLRNSLTGIIGYLSLLSAKVFDNEDEHDAYVSLAEESSEELFAFISSIDDVSSSDNSKGNIDLATLQFDKVYRSASRDLDLFYNDGHEFAVSIADEESPARVVADFELLKGALLEIFRALTADIDRIEIQASATENPYESATEIQIMTSPNPTVTEMIGIYKHSSNKLIEALANDRNDILLHLSIAASNFRLLNGTMNVETFGAEEGNIVQITLPINRK